MNNAFKKPIFARSSVLWLALEQIKREFRTRKNNSGAKAIIGRIALLALLGFACYASGQVFVMTLQSKHFDFDTIKLIAGQKLALGFISLFFMSLMTSFMYLTDRSDSDLLLSAPIEPKKIIMSRLLAATWRTTLLFSMFSTLFLGLAALTVSPKYFSYIPTAIGLAFLEGGLTFIAARFALNKFGLKNGRRIVQTLGFIGVFGGIILMQPKSRKIETSADAIFNQSKSLFPPEVNEFLTWWGGALLGDWVAAFATLLLGAIVFIILGNWGGKYFAQDLANLSGQNDGTSNKTKANKKFNKNIYSLFLKKEFRSIVRDPTMLVQLVAPLAGLVPALMAIVNSGDELDENIGYIAGPMLVFLSGTITSSLAWLVVSVEEANDLLRTSPTSQMKIFISKCTAAFIPGFIELLLFCALIGYFNLGAGIITFILGTLANISLVAIEYARPKPAKRPKMMQKPDRSISAIIFGLVVTLVWAIAVGVANYSLWWAIIPVVLAGILTAWAVFDVKNPDEDAPKPVWAKT